MPGGGEGSQLGVLERRGEDVHLRWWRGWRCLGEWERWWRGLGLEDGYGRRGEREGEVDMGRRWRAWRRLGEREWWWQGLGLVDGYGGRGERGARWGLWGEGEVDVGRRWRAWRRWGEREPWWRGLGVGVPYWRRGEREVRWCSWGEGEVDMRPRWRAWWRQEERERWERGPGGSWWRLGERKRRQWVIEARWRCGECGRRGLVCRAGGERERRCLRDRASSLHSGHSGGLGGSWGASRGAACYCGGGGGPPSSMDLPCRGVVAAAAGGMGRLTVSGGVGSGGPPRRGHGCRGDTVAGTGGTAPGGRWGMRLERSVTAIPYAGAVRAREVVARWGRVVGSGSGGGGVAGGGCGAAGGGGASSGGVGVAGMALGPLAGIPVPLVGGPGVQHRAQPLGLYCSEGRGGGSGAWLNGDSGRGVPRPWVGLAGGVGGLWGLNDGALGDGDVYEGLDGVVLGGPLCGGGGRWWEGGVGCGRWGVLVWVRVWVRAVFLGLVSLRLWCCVRLLGRRLGFGVGFGVGVRFQVEEDLDRRCEGAGARSGVFPVRCRGACVACVGVGGSVGAAAALAFAVALWMRAAGRGGSEDEVEEVDEAEDEEEVVDAGLAVMRAVAGLWAAASAAATAGRMQGMSSSCRLGAGGWRGTVVTWRPGWPIRSAAAGEGGAGLWPSPSRLGWAGVLQCVRLRGLTSTGGSSSRGLHSGAGGGWAWVFWAVRGGRVRATGWVGRAAGRGAPLGGCVRAVECERW